MNQSIRLLCMWALAVSLMGFFLIAEAETATPPPANDVTKAIGSRVSQAEGILEGEQNTNARKLANYDAYSEDASDAKRLTDIAAYCKGSNGQQSNKCDYMQANSGNNMLGNAFLDVHAYETDAQRDAAYQYIKAITSPYPAGYPEKEGDFFNDHGGFTDAGIDYFSSMYQKIPALTLSQNSLLAVYGDRVRLDNLAQGLPTVGEDGKASWMEIMHYEVERRYMNPEWYDQMNAAPTDAVLREMANMMAFQNYMELKRYEQMSRIEVLLAAQGNMFSGITGDFSEMAKEQEEEEKKNSKDGKKKSNAEKQGELESGFSGALGGGGK